MGIGISVLLSAVGLILALAVNKNFSGVDIQVVGWILVAAGVVGLILEIALFAPRRRYPAAGRTEVRERSVVNPPIVEERRTYEDPRY